LNSYLLHNTVYLLFILPKHTSRTHYPLHRLYLNIHSRTILKKNFTYTVQNVINNFVILLLWLATVGLLRIPSNPVRRAVASFQFLIGFARPEQYVK